MRRICMNQMMVDVKMIENVTCGDIAVIIGKSGKMEIATNDLAEQSDTITNEILSRMRRRVNRFFVPDSSYD